MNGTEANGTKRTMLWLVSGGAATVLSAGSGVNYVYQQLHDLNSRQGMTAQATATNAANIGSLRHDLDVGTEDRYKRADADRDQQRLQDQLDKLERRVERLERHGGQP